MTARRRAVVLLSGGLDSATCLYWALDRGLRPEALAVRYGQRHGRELRSAERLARAAGVPLTVAELRLPWLGSSSLIDESRALPELPLRRIGRGGVPSTYVPGRNAVFLALAASLADARGADSLVIGANALDFSGYPDCRPPFIRSFSRAVRLGTRLGRLTVLAPLLRMDKEAIVRLALRLGVPLERTWSCYRGGARPCGRCDSCKLRASGFSRAGARDPVLGGRS